jgi:hypothetical protein
MKPGGPVRNLIVAAVLFASTLVHAEQQAPAPPKKPLTTEQIQQLQDIDRARAALEVLKKNFEALAAKHTYQCMSAIGSRIFCSCLSENVPAVADLSMYVAVTTTSKEEIGYDKLSADDRKVVDGILAGRDKCVAEAFPGTNR